MFMIKFVKLACIDLFPPPTFHILHLLYLFDNTLTFKVRWKIKSFFYFFKLLQLIVFFGRASVVSRRWMHWLLVSYIPPLEKMSTGGFQLQFLLAMLRWFLNLWEIRAIKGWKWFTNPVSPCNFLNFSLQLQFLSPLWLHNLFLSNKRQNNGKFNLLNLDSIFLFYINITFYSQGIRKHEVNTRTI